MTGFLDSLGWIDLTSLVILVLFGVLGLFRGFLWQASRLASLFLGYLLASLFAEDFAAWIRVKFEMGNERVSVYLAFFVIFLAVLVVLSLLTILIHRLVKKLELSFYDHVGGGIMGVATGGAILIALLGILYFLAPEGPLVTEARESRTGVFAREVVRRVGFIPPQITKLYALPGGDTGAGAGEGEAPGKKGPEGAGPVEGTYRKKGR